MKSKIRDIRYRRHYENFYAQDLREAYLDYKAYKKGLRQMRKIARKTKWILRWRNFRDRIKSN